MPNTLPNFIQIPENLHRDYIQHALYSNLKKYKFWSFKEKGSNSGFTNSSAYTKKFSEAQNDVVNAQNNYNDAKEEYDFQHRA